MAEDKESGLAQSHESNAWFEAIGSRGFASLGAALGLAFSLVLVWATALLYLRLPLVRKPARWFRLRNHRVKR